MLDSLGDVGHTAFLTPDEAEVAESNISGHFYGIGAELGLKEGQPVIVAPLDGSPAQKAGIRAGDLLIQVDGQPVSSLPLTEIVARIRGPEGTPVRLTVIHPGETTPVEITIIRAGVEIPSVTWSVLPGQPIAHVRISHFAGNANDQLVAAIKAMRGDEVQALIVDVRHNPGGLLEQTVAVSSQFLREGNVLLEEDSRGNRKPYPARPGGLVTDMPLVVLIDEGTASAAEIFAGAIQDHQRGVLIGQRTFGTGTVLSTYHLSDGSVLLLGTALWLTPNGRRIRGNGISPDIEVALPPESTPLTPNVEKGLSAEEIQASGDAQLLRAIEELQREIR